MASRQELLESIHPNMYLTKSFLKRIYGYELTWPGFAEEAISKLEMVGCSKVREYYDTWVAEYQKEHDEMMRRVAKWYVKQDFYRKDVKKPRRERETELTKKSSTKWMDGLY